MLIVACSLALAIGFIELEGLGYGEAWPRRFPRLFGAGAEGARGLLSTIAGSMITVAGVTFSITVVALALAASQYTSRVVGNLMRDRANQIVLGVFLGVFAYCLVVLRTIRGGDDGVFVPSLAVFVALLLALVALGHLIYFIHHIAASIQVASIIQSTAAETLLAVDRLFPTELGKSTAETPQEPLDEAGRTWQAVTTAETGYVRGIDAEALLELSRSRRAVARMEAGVGEFVVEGAPLLSVDQPLDDRAVRDARAIYTIGAQRTVQQDCSYGIRQLVDVALRALSPGINDPTTAINCIDFIGAILVRLASRQLESRQRVEKGQVRVIARVASFADLLAEPMDEIRRVAAHDPRILRRLLDVLAVVAKRTSVAERLDAVALHAERVASTARSSVAGLEEREALCSAARKVSEHCSAAKEALALGAASAS